MEASLSSSTRHTRKRLVAGGFAALLAASGVAALAPSASAKDFAQVINAPAALNAPGVGGLARLAGADRYATAAAVSAATYPGAGRNDVILASGVNFPDGLAAAGLAGTVDSPVLLTDPTSLPSVTLNELARLTSGTAKRVHVMGGTAAISASVRAQLASLGYTVVENYNGANRYDTAAKIATAIGPANVGGIGLAGLRTAILATGDNYADALAAGSLSAAAKLPILLTTPSALPTETSAVLTSLAIKQVIVMGGTAAISDAVTTSLTGMGITVVRQAGVTRADTAARLANYIDTNGAGFGFNKTRVVIFNGYQSFADGLSAGPHAGKLGANLIPVSDTVVAPEAAAYLSANKATIVLVQAVGGTAVIPDAVLTSAISAASIATPTATITAAPGATSFTVTFSEAVTPGTVVPGAFQVLSVTSGAPTAVTPLGSSNTTFLVTLPGPLSAGDIIRLAQGAAPIATGLSAVVTPGGSNVGTATLTVAADVTRPSVTLTGATGLSSFTATFSEPVVALPTFTITRPGGGAPTVVLPAAPANCALPAGAPVLTCTIATSAPLATNDTITVLAGSYTDPSLNPGLGASITVTPDVVRPAVLSARATNINSAAAAYGPAAGLTITARTLGSSGNANTIQIVAGGLGTAPAVTTTANAAGGQNIVVTLGSGGNTAAQVAAAINANATLSGLFTVAGDATPLAVVAATPFTGGVTSSTVVVTYSEPIAAPGTVTLDVNGDNVIAAPVDTVLNPVSAVGATVTYSVVANGTAPAAGPPQIVLAAPIVGLSKLQITGVADPSGNVITPTTVTVS